MGRAATTAKYCPYCEKETICRPRGFDYKKRRRWLCTNCNRTFTEGARSKKVKQYVQQFCPYCEENTPCQKYGYDKKGRRRWLCTKCNRIFTEGVKFHQQVIVNCPDCKEATYPIRWKCAICGKTYMTTSTGEVVEVKESDETKEKRGFFRRIFKKIFK